MKRHITPCRICGNPAGNYHMNGATPGDRYDWYCESCFDRIQRRAKE